MTTSNTPASDAPEATTDPWAIPLIDGSRSRIPESFAALRYRDFRLLLAGLFMALSGWWMILVAQGWLVLEMTDSASAVALVSAMLSLPWLLLAPFSGVLADRIYRKHLLLTTRTTVAVLMLIEGVLILSGLIEFWHMVVLAFLAGSAFAMDIPARQSLIPDTVPKSVVANAVGINTSVFSMTTIAGPMVAAAILGWLGPGGCFLANAVGNVCLASAIFLMRIPNRPRVGRMNFIGDFMGGLRYVRTQPLLLMLLSVSLTLILTTRSWQQIAPVFVREEGVEARSVPENPLDDCLGFVGEWIASEDCRFGVRLDLRPDPVAARIQQDTVHRDVDDLQDLPVVLPGNRLRLCRFRDLALDLGDSGFLSGGHRQVPR